MAQVAGDLSQVVWEWLRGERKMSDLEYLGMACPWLDCVMCWKSLFEADDCDEE